MDLFEQAALAYITAPPWRFVRPQFELPFRDGRGGSCPDFVALDFKLSTVFVVEVTCNSNIDGLAERAKTRHTRWYEPLRTQLAEVAPWVAQWPLRTALIIRGDCFDKMTRRLSDESDVSVIAIDAILRPWLWNWEAKAYPANPLHEHVPPHDVA